MGLGPDLIGSVAVALDTFQNAQDESDNAVRIIMDGDVTREIGASPAPFDLNGSSDPFTMWVDYNGTLDLLEVFLSQTGDKPADPLVSAGFRLDDVVGETAYFGFTASTAVGQWQDHNVLSWELQTGDDLFV